MTFNYEQYNKETINGAGLDYDSLTADQRSVVLIPVEAPENYFCDGEVTRTQAKAMWKRQLQRAGLKPAQITKAVRAFA